MHNSPLDKPKPPKENSSPNGNSAGVLAKIYQRSQGSLLDCSSLFWASERIS